MLLTQEKVTLPLDVMAFINVRFTYKSKGLINISGFHVDPGFDSKLIFSVYNAGPSDILLRRGEPMFMIFFERLHNEVKPSTRRVFRNIPIEMIADIRGNSATLASNADKIKHLELYNKVMMGLMTIIFTMLASLIGYMFTR